MFTLSVGWIVLFVAVSVVPAIAVEKYRDGIEHTLDSTVYDWVMYESRTRTMTVRNVRGGVYEYYEVPRSVFEGFVESRTKGGYFRAQIERKFESQQLAR